MTPHDVEVKARAERARQIALFRYRLIQQVIDRDVSTRQRGRILRQIAAQTHLSPGGTMMRVSRKTLDRWLRHWRMGGFEALLPAARQVDPRTSAGLLELAVALKKENPHRTAVQIREIMLRHNGEAPHERTIQRHFRRLELSVSLTRDGEEDHSRVFTRFEAARPNQLWVGDACHGPKIGGRRAILFCFLDDHSRAVMAARFAFGEDVVRLAAALRPALTCRGVPEAVYVDNGSAFVDSWLLRACASLGIKLVHSTPNRPEGRGKIERFFRTVRDQFLVEFDGAHPRPLTNLRELNRLFNSWVETVYHPRVHSETGMAPLRRWQAGLPHPPALPSSGALAEAFLWEERRTVDKTSLFSLFGNYYQVDPILARRRVQVLFDPFDLAQVEVRHEGRSYGQAVLFERKRHAHPKTRRAVEDHVDLPAEPTGIDYLTALDKARTDQLAQSINYTALFPQPTPAGHDEHDEGKVA